MKKTLMLFIWFLKFGLLRPRDEYNLHDYIKARFCPKYIPAEDFDDKEQLLRDTPGPAGIKYAYYVGSKVNGFIGAVAAITALLIPVIAIAIAIFYAYRPLMNIKILSLYITEKIFNGMHAAAMGLVISQLYKIIYFNTVNRKSLIIILPAGFIFVFSNAIISDGAYEIVPMPFYLLTVVVLGLIFGITHDIAVKYRIKHPKRYDPYSKKAIKLRDRQIREEEENMKKYIDDDSIKRRKQQLEEELKIKKHKGEE